MKYQVGQKLIFKKDGHDAFTKGKVYVIDSFLEYDSRLLQYRIEEQIEYRMVRDDNQIGIWWEGEVTESFMSIKEERKLKLKKIKKCSTKEIL